MLRDIVNSPFPKVRKSATPISAAPCAWVSPRGSSAPNRSHAASTACTASGVPRSNATFAATSACAAVGASAVAVAKRAVYSWLSVIVYPERGRTTCARIQQMMLAFAILPPPATNRPRGRETASAHGDDRQIMGVTQEKTRRVDPEYRSSRPSLAAAHRARASHRPR